MKKIENFDRFLYGYALTLRENSRLDSIDAAIKEMAKMSGRSYRTVHDWVYGNQTNLAKQDFELVEKTFGYSLRDCEFSMAYHEVFPNGAPDPRIEAITGYESFIELLRDTVEMIRTESAALMGFSEKESRIWIGRTSSSSKAKDHMMNPSMLRTALRYFPLLLALQDERVVCRYSSAGTLWRLFYTISTEQGMSPNDAALTVGIGGDSARSACMKISKGKAVESFRQKTTPVLLVQYIARHSTIPLLHAGDDGFISLEDWETLPGVAPPPTALKKVDAGLRQMEVVEKQPKVSSVVHHDAPELTLACAGHDEPVPVHEEFVCEVPSEEEKLESKPEPIIEQVHAVLVDANVDPSAVVEDIKTLLSSGAMLFSSLSQSFGILGEIFARQRVPENIPPVVALPSLSIQKVPEPTHLPAANQSAMGYTEGDAKELVIVLGLARAEIYKAINRIAIDDKVTRVLLMRIAGQEIDELANALYVLSDNAGPYAGAQLLRHSRDFQAGERDKVVNGIVDKTKKGQKGGEP